MQVFDDCLHTEPYRLYGESAFVYLNRSAQPEVCRARDVVEEWFIHIPPDARNDLRARLRSADDPQHHGAFFELLLHELHRRLDCEIILHPAAPSGRGKRPDFLVRPRGAAPFYLEAVVATGEPRERLAARARLNDCYRNLDRVASPNFFLHLEVDGSAATPIPGRRLRRKVEAALAGLDPDQVAQLLESGGLHALPQIEFSHEDLTLQITPIPKAPSRRGTVGRAIGSRFGLQYLESDVAIRDAVVEKANRYGKLDLPYVIAVNALLEHVDHIDIANALFGSEAFHVPMLPDGRPGPGQMMRSPDGAWTSRSGPRYTRVSAVLLGVGVTALTSDTAPMRLYHHPWAAKPYDSVLTRLPTAALRPRLRNVSAAYFPDDCFVLHEGQSLTELGLFPSDL